MGSWVLHTNFSKISGISKLNNDRGSAEKKTPLKICIDT
jgi:hypothetical protein